MGNGPNESYIIKNEILVIINDNSFEIGVYYVPLHHSFIRDYLFVRKVGLADHMMHSFYK